MLPLMTGTGWEGEWLLLRFKPQKFGRSISVLPKPSFDPQPSEAITSPSDFCINESDFTPEQA